MGNKDSQQDKQNTKQEQPPTKPENTGTSQKEEDEKIDDASATRQQNKHVKGESFNPGLIISKGVASKKELPKVEPLGVITLEELVKYHCNNADRRLLSLFGVVFDVTAAVGKYGPEGSYKDFAGHDITLALGAGKLQTKWLDKFVKMSDKHIDAAQGWCEFYESQYPKAGTLKKWEEDQTKWPALTEQETTELNEECIVM
eukprot:139062_1